MVDQEVHSAAKSPAIDRAASQQGPAPAIVVTKAVLAGHDAAETGAREADLAARSCSEAIGAMLEQSTTTFAKAVDHWVRHGGNAVDRSQPRFQAMADFNGLIVKGLMDLSQIWTDLAVSQTHRRLEGLEASMRCRSSEAFVSAQRKLLQDDLEQIFETGRRIAEVSVRVTHETAQTVAIIAIPAVG